MDGDDPTNYDFFRNKETGELINYDPRLEPEKLEKRGVKLEWFYQYDLKAGNLLKTAYYCNMV